MSPELLNAVKERVTLGHSDEQISAELIATGYDEETIRQVIAQTKNEGQGVSVGTIAGQSSHVPNSAPVTNFPTIGRLIGNAFIFLKARSDLLLLMVSSALLLFVFEQTNGMFLDPNNSSYAILSSLSTLAFLIFSLFIISTALYIVAKSPTERVSLSAGLAWAKINLVAVIWITILVAPVIMIGFILLVIPGIILFIALLFSQFSYIEEGKKGLSALLRSRDLVKGNWWKVFTPLILTICLVIFSKAILLALLNPILSITSLGEVATQTLEFVFGPLFLVIMLLLILHIIMQLFVHLRSVGPNPVQKEAEVGRGKYLALVLFSIVLFPFAVMAMYPLFMYLLFFLVSQR